MARVSLSPAQSKVYRDLFLIPRDEYFRQASIRHAVVVASRGFGKSYLAASAGITAVDELMELPKSVPNKNVSIIAPTFSQVSEIYIPLLHDVFDIGRRVRKIDNTHNIFYFKNGVKLRLWSAEALERMRGTGQYFVVKDEVSSWSRGPGHKSAWQDIVEPCINTRWAPKQATEFGSKPGRSLTISTPMGYNFLYDMFQMGRDVNEPHFASYHFDFHQAPHLDADELSKLKSRLDPLTYAREYLASFEESGTNVFYQFDRNIHVRNIDMPREFEDIFVSIDFNVSIMASTFWVHRNGQLQAFAESKGMPNTEELAILINQKFKNGLRKIRTFPDPAGKQRKSSAVVGQTDFAILQNAGFVIHARDAHPSIKDSATCVNARLLNANGDVNMFISPECKETIKSLERTSWVENRPDLAVIDKSEGVEHFSDGVRYLAEYLYPIKRGHVQARRTGIGRF